MVCQLRSCLDGERLPGAINVSLFAAGAGDLEFAEIDRTFISHLDKEQVGNLLDIVAVVDAIMAKGVAESPELLGNVSHGGSMFRFLRLRGNCLVQLSEQISQASIEHLIRFPPTSGTFKHWQAVEIFPIN